MDAYRQGYETAKRYSVQPPHQFDIWKAHGHELPVDGDQRENWLDGFIMGISELPPFWSKSNA